MKFKVRYLIIIALMALVSLFVVQSAQAHQETCPATGDWVKVDGINAQSYFYTAPEGKVVVETCYKAGTTVKHETIDPPQASLTVTTDVPNPNNNACQDISHASFRLADEPKEEFGSASVQIGECGFNVNDGSLINVELTINNAILTINGKQYTSSQTIQLPPGEYAWSWVGGDGYSGSGGSTIVLEPCEPGKGDVSVDIGQCTFDANEGSLINVALTIQNAVLTIDGKNYSSSQTIKLAPGTYVYTWEATDDNEGSGNGAITVYGCEPATASVDLGQCSWNAQGSTTSATITVSGATLVIKLGDTEFGSYGPGTYNVDLPVGSYTYTWTANENFTGSGSGSFSTVSCEPGKSDASVDLGSCTNDNGQSYSDISITISNAILTINGKDYTESAVLKLEPGDYAYSWQAIDDNFAGSGEGILTVTNCAPKVSADPSIDVAAGGSGPSVINSVAPLLAGVAGLGLASIFVFKGKKEN